MKPGSPEDLSFVVACIGESFCLSDEEIERAQSQYRDGNDEHWYPPIGPWPEHVTDAMKEAFRKGQL